MDLSFTTKSPLVSDRPRLNLSVKPRVVRAGRRTVFTFSTAEGTVIRFAGKQARASRKRRATIAATLQHAGLWRATATKPGFVPAHATVRVREGD